MTPRVLFDYKKGNGWVDILISADKVEKVVGVGYRAYTDKKVGKARVSRL